MLFIMDNNIHETIKDIKSKFRLFMNGMVSQSMREKGMEYKLNFGIEYPRIKEIAAGYEPDHELAQALWKENIRECKILAGLLQPADTFYPEIADIWIDDMGYPELAEYTVMNLFQRLPYASEVVFRWMADEEKEQHPEYSVTGGFLKHIEKETGRQMWWDGLSDRKKDIVMQLPNFDKDIFKEITGITVEG